VDVVSTHPSNGNIFYNIVRIDKRAEVCARVDEWKFIPYFFKFFKCYDTK